jgi:hypothetical protein
MNTQQAAVYNPMNVIAMGWALSTTFVTLFVICLIAALIFPDWGTAQGWVAWIALFSNAPIASARVWIEGILFSIAFGWVSAVVFACVYNYFIRSTVK